jgi:hypothetical protein
MTSCSETGGSLADCRREQNRRVWLTFHLWSLNVPEVLVQTCHSSDESEVSTCSQHGANCTWNSETIHDWNCQTFFTAFHVTRPVGPEIAVQKRYDISVGIESLLLVRYSIADRFKRAWNLQDSSRLFATPQRAVILLQELYRFLPDTARMFQVVSSITPRHYKTMEMSLDIRHPWRRRFAEIAIMPTLSFRLVIFLASSSLCHLTIRLVTTNAPWATEQIGERENTLNELVREDWSNEIGVLGELCMLSDVNYWEVVQRNHFWKEQRPVRHPMHRLKSILTDRHMMLITS